MTESPGIWSRLSAKPFSVLVIVAALAYLGLGVLGLDLALGIPLASAFGAIFVLFAALFLVSAAGSFLVRRWGIVAGMIVTIVFLLLFSFNIAPGFTDPASPGAWYIVTGVPVGLLVIVVSILSVRRWKAGVAQTPYLADARSTGGLLAFAVLGFAIGALVAGLAVAPLLTTLVAGAGQGADVRIVPNAMSVAVPFSPATLTVTNGTTVRWYNGDTNQHTVTGDTGAFASPVLDPGGWFSFTFTRTGTYPYHCEPHPNMTGTVVVT